MAVLKFLRHPMSSMDNWWDEVSPKRRIDFNFGNMFMLAALIVTSTSTILNGPTPLSVVNNMPETLQMTMCACILVGCAMKLHGAVAGRRFWFPRTSLKRCYTYGYSGAPIAMAGCIVYGYYIVRYVPNFWSALSGFSTPLFGIGIMLQAVLYFLEYRRIDRNEQNLRSMAADEKRADNR